MHHQRSEGSTAIFNIAEVMLNHGDEVIIPVPYWVTYKDVVNFAGGKCVFVPTDEASGFTFTAETIEPYITSRTKFMIINSPSNPSGAVLSRADFERIYHLAVKRGIYLVTDECYCRFLYEDEPFSIAAMPGAKDHVIVSGSLSKTYSMTGWRIGFTLAPKPVVEAMGKLQSHSTSNPTSIAQKAAVEALKRTAGLNKGDAGRVPAPARLRCQPVAGDAWGDAERAKGRFLRLSEHLGRIRQWHRFSDAVLRAPAL